MQPYQYTTHIDRVAPRKLCFGSGRWKGTEALVSCSQSFLSFTARIHNCKGAETNHKLDARLSICGLCTGYNFFLF